MPNPSLASLLTDSAARHPDRTAIVLDGSRMTYAEVDAASNQVAHLLIEQGVQRGDKVALSCVNVPWFTVAYFGILKAGAAVVPLNVLLKGREIAYHLGDCDAKAYLCFQDTPDLAIGTQGHAGFADTASCDHFFVITGDPSAASGIEGVETLAAAMQGRSTEVPEVEVAADDTAVILYTSGTTGQPKGAELRHRNMRDNALAGAQLFGADAADPDTYLCVLPLFHSFGQTVIQNGAFAFGGTIVMLPRFEAGAALQLMLAEKVSFFAGVPTMYWGLLGAIEAPTDTSDLAANLRVAVSGGAALPVEIHKQFHDRFDVTILEGYGLSETSPVASFSALGEAPRVGSIGTPIPGVEMQLLEPDSWNPIPSTVEEDGKTAVGEIAIKGHNVMKGYYNRPEATDEVVRDGWFRTGDLGKRDADGWYFIVDRSKDMIIRGGFNVYPREIEEVLITHPEVSLAAVIGVPHDRHGEEIKAHVVLTPEAQSTPEELVAWCQQQMAAYKYPRIVEIAPSLPMTATGKILKRELA